jgi:tRNA(adenine34) deaminase
MKTALFTDHQWFMNMALDEAIKAYREQEVPIGAVLISPNGEVLAKAHNLKEKTFDATAHAEILCLKEGSEKLQNWRLSDCILYVTLEPCPMCLSAMAQARIKACIFGAYDPKGGALSLGYHFQSDRRLNHKFSIMGGVKHYECSKILSQFFKERRESYKK